MLSCSSVLVNHPADFCTETPPLLRDSSSADQLRHFREERASRRRIEAGVPGARIPRVAFFDSLGLLFRGKTVRYGLL